MLNFSAISLFLVILSEAKDLLHRRISNLQKQILRRFAPLNDIAENFNKLLTRYTEAIGLIDVFEADEQLAAEALSTAIRYNHSVYDMLYVILARRHSCTVLTVDKKLAALVRQLDESTPPAPPTKSGPT